MHHQNVCVWQKPQPHVVRRAHPPCRREHSRPLGPSQTGRNAPGSASQTPPVHVAGQRMAQLHCNHAWCSGRGVAWSDRSGCSWVLFTNSSCACWRAAHSIEWWDHCAMHAVRPGFAGVEPSSSHTAINGGESAEGGRRMVARAPEEVHTGWVIACVPIDAHQTPPPANPRRRYPSHLHDGEKTPCRWPSLHAPTLLTAPAAIRVPA